MSMSDLLKAIKNSLSSDTQQNITLSSHKAPKSLSSKFPETSLWLELSSFLLDLLFDIWPLGCKTLALSSWNVTGASCQLPDISAWHTILLLCATRQKMQGNGLVLNSVSIKDGRHSWVLPHKQKRSLFWRSKQPLPWSFSAYTKYVTCCTGVGTVLKKCLNVPQTSSQHTCSTFLSKAGLLKRTRFQCLQGPDAAVNLTCSNGQVVSCSFTRSNLTFSHWPGVTLLCRRRSSHIISVLHNLLKVCN